MGNQSIKFKLGLLCAFFIVAILGVGLIGLHSTQNMIEKAADLGEVQVPAVRNMTLTDMMHDGLRAVVYQSLFMSKYQDSARKKEIADELEEMTQNLKTYLSVLAKLEVREETRKAIEESGPELDAYVQSAREIVRLALERQTDQAILNLPSFQKAFSSLEVKLERLGEMIERDADRSRKEANEIGSASKRNSLIFVMLTLALGTAYSFWFTMGLSKSLVKIADHLSQSVNQVTTASQQIASSSQNLSEANAVQSSALDQTAASLEEITAMIAKAAESAQTASSRSADSQRKAEEGRKATDEMLLSIDEISQSNLDIMTQIDLSNDQMYEVVKVIQGIGNKTNVINEIVFQTKLLSFNASVEAARAGEHGKGFAVVAEEVGNLAQMSGTASKEISDMLHESILKVETIANETKSKVQALVTQGRKKVENGMVVARESSGLLNEIVANVNQVTELSHEISLATKEQAQGVREINHSMGQLDSLTKKNSASSEENALTATQLSEQAESLKNSLDELLTTIQGPSRAESKKAA